MLSALCTSGMVFVFDGVLVLVLWTDFVPRFGRVEGRDGVLGGEQVCMYVLVVSIVSRCFS